MLWNHPEPLPDRGRYAVVWMRHALEHSLAPMWTLAQARDPERPGAWRDLADNLGAVVVFPRVVEENDRRGQPRRSLPVIVKERLAATAPPKLAATLRVSVAERGLVSSSWLLERRCAAHRSSMRTRVWLMPATRTRST
mgnify:CR=1 FL=1